MWDLWPPNDIELEFFAISDQAFVFPVRCLVLLEGVKNLERDNSLQRPLGSKVSNWRQALQRGRKVSYFIWQWFYFSRPIINIPIQTPVILPWLPSPKTITTQWELQGLPAITVGKFWSSQTWHNTKQTGLHPTLLVNKSFQFVIYITLPVSAFVWNKTENKTITHCTCTAGSFACSQGHWDQSFDR